MNKKWWTAYISYLFLYCGIAAASVFLPPIGIVNEGVGRAFPLHILACLSPVFKISKPFWSSIFVGSIVMFLSVFFFSFLFGVVEHNSTITLMILFLGFVFYLVVSAGAGFIAQKIYPDFRVF